MVVPGDSLAAALVLSGLLLGALVVRLLLARQIETPWIMVDEFIYSELAKSFAEHGEFLLREAPAPFNSLAYPALISPAWLIEPVETAYEIARVINVVLMVLAAVPVYLWGKRLMGPGYALVAAVLVLMMPALTYTGMLMTENAFFPAVVTACFLIALTLERPTVLHQALALAAIGVASAIRFQGLVLLVVLATALALKLVLDLRAPDGGRGVRFVLQELRRFLPSALTLVLLAGAYVVVKASEGAGLESGLGSYGGIVKVEYDVSSAAGWVVDHFAELSLSVAVVPVSALIVLFGLAVRGWATNATERAFLAVAASAFVLIVVQVGVYASRFALRIEERNMFSVAPLLFLALMLWIARGMPRPLLLTAFAAFIPAALLLTLDLGSLLNVGILSDSFGLIPLLRLSGQIDGGVEAVETILWIGGFAAGLAFALVPRRYAKVVLPAGLALFLVVSSYSVFGAIRDHARATRALTGAFDASWIDHRIGTGSDAVFLYGGTADLRNEAQVMWQTEFWNRSIGAVSRLGAPEPAPLPESTARFHPVTGRLEPESGSASAGIRYMVAPTGVELSGTSLESQGPLTLYRVEEPVRLISHLGGVYPDGWMGSDAALTHYASPGRSRRLSVRVSRPEWMRRSPRSLVTIAIGPIGDLNGAPTIAHVTARRKWTIQTGMSRRFELPTPSSGFRLQIHVEPTFSPASFGGGDTRHLGARLELSLGS
jgi:hypothetical protein